MTDKGLLRIDRRVTLRWLAVAMASGQLAACGQGAKGLSWPEVAAVQARGFGKDPDLLNPVRPWPLTLTDAQRLILSRLVDLILPGEGELPAASAVGVPDFIDEWVSAPYPDQAKDRPLLLDGLRWIEEEAQRRHHMTFAELSTEQQTAICETVADAANAELIDVRAAPFFKRFRDLAFGAWCTTPDGMKAIGYVGNMPSGIFEGPPTEALKHVGLA